MEKAFHVWLLRVWHRARLYLTNFVEASAEALFEALVGGLVVGAASEIVGEAGHVCDFIIEIVGVFVALAVDDVFHEARERLAEVERYRVGLGFVNVIGELGG